MKIYVIDSDKDQMDPEKDQMDQDKDGTDLDKGRMDPDKKGSKRRLNGSGGFWSYPTMPRSNEVKPEMSSRQYFSQTYF